MDRYQAQYSGLVVVAGPWLRERRLASGVNGFILVVS